jgi:2-polyprenyl-6-methoxyphenol hydroxylase-like FAD-dependent oxidoreductase
MALGVDVDVIVAGGGVAGTAAAAALGEFGRSVLVVEPGQHSERRLAGELIHPQGLAGLVELGLYDADSFADAVPIHGFRIFPDGNTEGPGIQLPYRRPSGIHTTGCALEHGAIRANLDAAVTRLGHVTMWRGSRVVGLDLTGRATPSVSIACNAGKKTLRCRMIVGADGASSSVRSLAGIVHRRRPLSRISGYLISRDALPAPGFGHVFMGETLPLLAYEIGGGRARVLFDHPIGAERPRPDYRARVMATLPLRLRTAITASAEKQRTLGSVSADVFVGAVARGPLVLAGDAGGSCHPLTATGLTVAIGDALRLRQALCDRDGEPASAAALYAKRRRPAQRARMLLASALHETTCRQDPPARLIREGLIRYWEHDARGREASMALLAMADTQCVSILREMLRIVLLGMAGRTECRSNSFRDRMGVRPRLTFALAALLLRHLPMVMKAR